MVQKGPLLVQPYLSRVGGEEEHDGEARQQAGILDGKGEEEAAAARVLFLTTHLVHLWKLRSTKQSDNNLVKLVFGVIVFKIILIYISCSATAPKFFIDRLHYKVHGWSLKDVGHLPGR